MPGKPRNAVHRAACGHAFAHEEKPITEALELSRTYQAFVAGAKFQVLDFELERGKLRSAKLTIDRLRRENEILLNFVKMVHSPASREEARSPEFVMAWRKRMRKIAYELLQRRVK